jgi:hypothetical protein
VLYLFLMILDTYMYVIRLAMHFAYDIMQWFYLS